MHRQPGGTASARTAGTLLGEYTEGRQFVGWRGPVSATRAYRKPRAETPRWFTWNAAQVRGRGRGPGHRSGSAWNARGGRATRRTPGAVSRETRPGPTRPPKGEVRADAQPGPGSARRPGPRHEATRCKFEAAKRGAGPRGRGGEARLRATRPRHEAARGHAARGKSIGATSRKAVIRASKGAPVTLSSRGRKGPEW